MPAEGARFALRFSRACYRVSMPSRFALPRAVANPGFVLSVALRQMYQFSSLRTRSGPSVLTGKPREGNGQQITRLAASVLVLFSVALIYGCGSDDAPETVPAALSEAEYQEAIRGILTDSQDAGSLFFDLVVRQPHDECAELIVSFHRELEQLIERAAELRPPRALESIHARFVEAARESVGRVAEIESEVLAGELACGPKLNDQLYAMPSTEAAEDALSDLEDRGYVVFGR